MFHLIIQSMFLICLGKIFFYVVDQDPGGKGKTVTEPLLGGKPGVKPVYRDNENVSYTIIVCGTIKLMHHA